MKAVSVIVATYRRDAALKNALDSLACQTYPHMEIVLVDDNGDADWNEKVEAVADGFRRNHPQLPLTLLVNHPNQGSAKARNIGINAAKGAYITFLDDDDVYLPDKVKTQVEFMERGGYDYSLTDLVLYNEDGRPVDRRVRTYLKETAVSALQVYHLKYHLTGTDTMMFKKDYLTQIGGFAPIDVGDEFYLMQRAIEGGGAFAYLPGCEVKAYVHTGEGGLSSGEGKIRGENALYEYKKGFFKHLSRKDVRYIKMRHYAVVAYAELRRKRYGAFVGNAAKAVLSAPLQSFSLVSK